MNLKVFIGLLVCTLSTASFAQSSRYVISGLKGRTEIEAVGGKFQHNLRYHNAVVANMDDKAVQILKNKFPQIQVEKDHIVTLVKRPSNPGGGNGGTGDTTPPPQVVPWGISRIKATDAHAINKGAGVTVCVVDTGVDIDHPDLADNIVGGENFVSIKGKIDPLQYNDDNDHGTHVSGTIAAIDNTEGVIGVAPEASIFGVKVLDKRGSGYTSAVADGVRSCIANGTQVISMSLGSSRSSTLLHDAIIDAHAAGIIIVAAAGNDYGSSVGYPAAHSEVLAISATDSNDNLASFSNVGPEIAFAAPGVSVLSTVKGGGYKSFSGTSMATPHVSGVFALMLSSGMSSVKADDIGLSANEQGQGLVNALRTVTEY